MFKIVYERKERKKKLVRSSRLVVNRRFIVKNFHSNKYPRICETSIHGGKNI